MNRLGAFVVVAVFMVGSVGQVEPTFGAEVELRKIGENAVAVTTPHFEVGWNEDGSSQLVWRKERITVLEWPAEISLTEAGKEPENWTREKLSARQEKDGRVTVTEVWSGPAQRARAMMTTHITPDKPYLWIDLSAENLEGKKKQLLLPYRCDLAEGYGNADKVLGFIHRRGLDTGLVFDLPKETVITQWGCGALSWRPPDGGGQRLNLPILCVFRAEHGGGPVIFSENRTSLGFEAGADRVGFFKRFYLRGEPGDVDDGIDLKDGDGKLPYRLYIGYVEKPSWDKLYLDFYLDAFPYLKGFEPAGAAALEPGIVTLGAGTFAEAPLELKWEEGGTRAAASSGATYFLLMYQHGNPELQEKNNLGKRGMEFTKAAGMVPLLWDNVKVAPENWPGSAKKYWDDQFSHRHFPDSWSTGADGSKPHKSWEGYECNQSLQFTFARHELATIKDQFERFGYEAFMLDYYGAGEGVDYIAGYDNGRYPFLPDQVSLSEYAKALADWLHSNNHILVANVPVECLGVLKFADYYWGDIGAEWGRIYKITIGARPFVLSGLTSDEVGLLDKHRDWLSGGLTFGYMTCVGGWGTRGWAYTGLMTEPERTQVLNIVAWNSRFLFDLSCSLLVGGELGKQHFFLSPSGRVFATARNMTAEDETLTIPFDSPRLNLNSEAHYTVFEWDIDTGATLREADITGEKLAAGLTLGLVPKQAKALVVLPMEETIVQPYLAAVPRVGLYVKHSTGKVVSAEWIDEGSEKRFSVSIDAPWGKSTTELAVPVGQEIEVGVHNGTVTSKERDGDVLHIELQHNPGVPGQQVDSKAVIELKLPGRQP